MTGAGRGLGRSFVDGLLGRGAAKVYAGSRVPNSWDDDRVVPIELDVTDPVQVRSAAERCRDVDLLVNNAGIMRLTPLIGSDDDSAARDELEVNFFGTLAMCRAFAPVLAANGGGAIVDVLSVASWVAPPASGGYGASKSAAWALTNAARVELREQGTLVVAVHAGFIDTEMVTRVKAPKISPADVVAQVLDGVESGAEEILADDESRETKAALPRDLEVLYPRLQRLWDGRRRGRARE
ncbi:short-chain dehydrogenase [Frondihabitans sucicola]|uniref:Short-chain dehydrogenase n=1 Tax=Frondihabitans sucicola TaxID=1268041 RepID=A0ABN6Y4I4_9MICO|nr:short-chain dehydrogenase [Frondihabitans sucicola]